MRILAIETSCDDTGIAILEYEKHGQPKVLADLVSSQVKIHAPWGGVVPTLAKREHQKNLTPLLYQALKQSKLLKITNYQLPITKQILQREEMLAKKLILFLKKYQKPEIDLIAVTVGPGLEPALWVGVNFAKALACAWDLPIVPVNHIEAHIAAALAFSTESQGSGKNKLSPYGRSPKGRQITNYHPSGDHPQGGKLLLPAICLVVSGGHTQLILMKKFGQYKIIGETRDDAAGEAFDKVAKMLGLPYPGGPAIAAEAVKFPTLRVVARRTTITNFQLPKKIKIQFPRPMINSKDFDFSFSGLKTAVLYFVKKLSRAELEKLTPAIAAEFQQAVVDVLMAKTIAAAKKYSAKTIMLSGGVAANDALRGNFRLRISNFGLNFLVPPKNFCTDNAVMVALTAAYKIKTSAWSKISAQVNLRLG